MLNICSVCETCSSEIFICEENNEEYTEYRPIQYSKGGKAFNPKEKNSNHNLQISRPISLVLKDDHNEQGTKSEHEKELLDYQNKTDVSMNESDHQSIDLEEKREDHEEVVDLKDKKEHLDFESMLEETKIEDEISNECDFVCKFCKFTSNEERMYKNHMEFRHSSKIPYYACDHCDMKCPTIVQLMTHINMSHVGSSRYFLGPKQTSRGSLYVFRKKSTPVCDKHVSRNSRCYREPFVTHKPYK